MTAQAFDWDAELSVDPQAEYQAVVRSLRRNRGFGLFFVQCSPLRGERLIEEVREQVSDKEIGVLKFQQEIPEGDFYQSVVTYFKQNAKVDILFVQGLELSLLSYERAGQAAGLLIEQERYSYSEKGVPRLLGNLNLRREMFRDEFPIGFVFLLPRFAMKYLVRRAPDFFDWRSGVFELPSEEEIIAQASSRLLAEGDYNRYLNWTQDERDRRHKEIQTWLDEPNQTSTGKAELLVQQALIFFASQNYELAVSSYDQALQYEEKAYIWSSRGAALSNLKRFEEALASYDRALEIEPNDLEALINRGNALNQLKRHEDAIASFDKALEIDSNAYRAWYGRSYTLSVLGRYEEAGHTSTIATQTEALVRVDPNLPQALYQRGYHLNSIRWFDQALISLEKLLELDPNNPSAWFQKGYALQEIGQHEAAIVADTKALELDPTEQAAFNNRGNALNSLGRYEEALIDFDRAIEMKPNDHLAWNNRGWSLTNLERYREALDCFDRAIELMPSCPTAKSNRKSVLEKLSQLERLEYYTEFLEHQPNDHETWYEKGLVLRDLKQYEDAIEAYDRAIETKPDHLSASQEWFQKGFALVELGRYGDGIAAYDKTLELDPTEQAAFNNRGNSQNNLKRYQEALVDLDRAIEIKPNDHLAWGNRGWTLFNLERYEEALESFDRSLTIDFNYSWSSNRRSEVLGRLSLEEQISYYERQLKHGFENHYVLVLYGRVLLNAGRYEAALSIYQKALEICPESHEAQHDCGTVLLNLDRYQEALSILNQAVESSSICPGAWFQRGTVHFRLAHWLEALSDFDRYAELSSNNAESWKYRGDALLNLKRYEDAIESYDRSLEYESNNYLIWKAKGIALWKLRYYEEALCSIEEALRICWRTGNQAGEAESLIILSAFYGQCNRIRASQMAATQGYELQQLLKLPLDNLSYPKWYKQLLQFAEIGKWQSIVFTSMVILFYLPYIAVLLLLMSWRFIYMTATQKHDRASSSPTTEYDRAIPLLEEQGSELKNFISYRHSEFLERSRQASYLLRFLSTASILAIAIVNLFLTFFILVNWVSPNLLILRQ